MYNGDILYNPHVVDTASLEVMNDLACIVTGVTGRVLSQVSSRDMETAAATTLSYKTSLKESYV